MSPPETPPQEPPFVRDTVIRELEHRRKKQWDIFSWASTLLTAITGGVVALETAEHPHTLTCGHHIALTIAVISLFAYSAIWVHNNLSFEEQAEAALITLDDPLPKLPTTKGSSLTARIRTEVGYVATLVLLTIAALAAIWIPA